MKTIHLAIVTGAGITIAVAIALFLVASFQPNPIQTSDLKFIKLEKLSSLDGIGAYNFQFSHDGKFLIFRQCMGSPNCSYWIMNLEGNKVRKIELPIQFIYINQPKISPNDNALLFTGDYDIYNGTRFTTHSALFEYLLAGKKLVQIENNTMLGPYDWVPDGNIVFVKYNDTMACLAGINTMSCANRIDDIHNIMWLANSDGKKIKKLYNGTEYFDSMSISPDGTKAVFVNQLYVYSYRNLYKLNMLDISNGRIMQLTDYSHDFYGSPIWSPDNKFIIYTAFTNHPVKGPTGGETSPAGWLGMMSVNGSGKNKIIFGNNTGQYDPPPISPTISPDGKQIIFGLDYDFYNGLVSGPGMYRLDLDPPL